MYSALKSYLVFILPVVLKYLFVLVFVEIDFLIYEDLIEDFFFVFISFLFLRHVLPNKKWLISSFLFFYVLYFILEATSYLVIMANFSSSYIYVLIESNKYELKEFISSYFNLKILLFLLSAIFSYLIIFRNYSYKKNKSVIKIVLIISLVIGLLKITGFIENNAYHNIVRGTYGYLKLQKGIKFNPNLKKEDIQINSANDIMVVVIGESTSRNYMQIYGYNKQTTPLLNSIKNEIKLYNNVISPDVLTLKAVPKLLTSLNNKTTSKENNNILQIFNKAGLDTYWLSNQRPISFHDNVITNIASSSKYIKFFNYNHENEDTNLDEVIFEDYEKILSQSGRKLICIRLMGTHFDYSKRYPKTFNEFDVEVPVSRKEEIINHYKNAVLYNDYIVYALINKLRKVNKKSALIYLSDHGENLFESSDFFGHSEANITKSMLEIPFLLWTSNDYEFPSDFEFVGNRKFMTDHFYESLGHFFGVVYKDVDISRSVFSNAFKASKRKILNKFNYDSIIINNE